MILGMSTAAFTFLHVVLSLIGIVAGLVVVQAFQKVLFLNALAPTQSEPPFAIAQAVVLLLFVALGIMAVRSFHPESKPHALSLA